MNREPSIVILLFISILIISCAPKIVGIPVETGLIVFEGEFNHLGSNSIKDVEFSFSSTPGNIKGKPIGKYIIFDNLIPGIYKIRKLFGFSPVDSGTATASANIEFYVEKSTAIYIGKYIIDADAEDYLTHDSNPVYEAQAWKFFLRFYKDSPWSKIIRERLPSPDALPGPAVSTKRLFKGKNVRYGIWIHPDIWRTRNIPSNRTHIVEFRFRHTSSEVYASVLPWMTATSYEYVKKVIIDFRTRQAGGRNITILSEEIRKVTGGEVLYLKMQAANRSGVPYIWFYYIYVGGGDSIRVITWTTKELFNIYEKDMADFLNGFEVYTKAG